MPDQKLGDDGESVPCAIGQTMCDESPIQSMRECNEAKKLNAELKEQQRLKKNKKARQLYAKKKAVREKGTRFIKHQRTTEGYENDTTRRDDAVIQMQL